MGKLSQKSMAFFFNYSLPHSFQILVQVLHMSLHATVVQAYKMVGGVVSTLKSMRSNSVAEFSKQFAKATKLGKQLHGEEFELSQPRFSGRMAHRSNPP